MAQAFFGYASDSKFFDMTHEEFVNYAKGEIIVSIGAGDFQNTANRMLNQAMARGAKAQVDSMIIKRNRYTNVK